MAILLDYPHRWCSGAPLPHVLSDGLGTYLIYYLSDYACTNEAKAHPIAAVLNPESEYLTALVEFKLCYCHKFGGMNDEVFHGHPLHERGLEGYRAHYIANSSWIKAEREINSVHDCYDSKAWDRYKHYFFTFHDEVFECIAEGYSIEIFQGSIRNVYGIAAQRLFECDAGFS